VKSIYWKQSAIYVVLVFIANTDTQYLTDETMLVVSVTYIKINY